MGSQAHWSYSLGRDFGPNLGGGSVTARVDRKVSLIQHAIVLLIQYNPTKVTINAELLIS